MEPVGSEQGRGEEGSTRDCVIVICSLAELTEHEPEILRRINAVPNGGNLFMTHPFMLFDDIGVEFSAAAREKLVAAEPQLANLSERPYNALKSSRSPQRVRVHLKALFRRTPQ